MRVCSHNQGVFFFFSIQPPLCPAHAHSPTDTGPRTAESKFTSPDAGSFGCKYTFAEPLALLCTLYRDEKTGVCQTKEGKITVTLRIAKGMQRNGGREREECVMRQSF